MSEVMEAPARGGVNRTAETRVRPSIRLYCFQPHYRAIANAWLPLFGMVGAERHRMLHQVTSSQEMAGNTPGSAAFIYIDNHCERVPTALMHMARIYGLIEIRLSDGWTRERLGGR